MKRDEHQPEPLQLIAMAFGLGMLIVLPAGIVNDTILSSQGFENVFQVTNLELHSQFKPGASANQFR